MAIDIPDVLPEWATDTNYAAGGDPWSGTATKIEPSAGIKAKGQIPETGFQSQHYNWLLHKFYESTRFHREVLCGGGHRVYDDFLHATIQDLWTLEGNGNESIADDSANGAPGSLLLDDSGLAGAAAHVMTPVLVIGTGDFHFAARVRCGVKDDTFLAGVFTGAFGLASGFYYNASSANWQLSVPGADTVTAVAVSTVAYQLLEAIRVDGEISFFIDGTAVEENTAETTDFATHLMGARNFIATGAPYPVNYVDFLKIVW
jgi:hypothetical protein